MLDLERAQVLVTGGAGFIGCAISQALADRCGRFVVMDNLHPQVHATADRPPQLHPAAELVIDNVTDGSGWDRLLSSFTPNVIIHLAAETGTAQSLTDSTRHAHVNVVGTTRMLDGLSDRDMLPDRILLCSSRAVYGEGRWRRSDGAMFYPGQRSHRQLESGQWDFPMAEGLPSSFDVTVARPTSVYGATKLAQENVLTAWCGAKGVALTVLRLQNVYGPGQSLTNSYTGIVTLFSQLARRDHAIPVYEDGRITRDFVFIDDVAAAIAAAVSTPPDDLVGLDIGSGVPTTVWDLACAIAEIRDAPRPQVNGKYRDGDVRYAACHPEQAMATLGWRPEWDLSRGLLALQDWIDVEL